MTIICLSFPVIITVKVRSQINLKFPCLCNVLRGYADRKERGWRGCLLGETKFGGGVFTALKVNSGKLVISFSSVGNLYY